MILFCAVLDDSTFGNRTHSRIVRAKNKPLSIHSGETVKIETEVEVTDELTGTPCSESHRQSTITETDIRDMRMRMRTCPLRVCESLWG